MPQFNLDDEQVQEALRKLKGEQPPEPKTSGPKFEPTESTPAGPDMAQYNADNPAPAMPVFNPDANANAPPEPVHAKSTMPGFDDENTPIPVYDNHGAPTGEIHGGGTDVEKRRAAVEAESNYKPENHNSTLAGIGLGAGRGFQQGGVLGALFGAINGGVNQSADEEFAHRRRLGIAEGNYQRSAKHNKDEQDTLNDETERAAKVARAILDRTKEKNDVDAKERQDALKNLQQYEKLDPANPTHAAAIARAKQSKWDIDPKTWNAGNVQTVFDQETGVQMQRPRGSDKWEPSLDNNGKPVTTKTQRQEKLPDSFYEFEGQNEKTIHADAVARAGVKDLSKTAELDQAKVDLFKNQLGIDDQGIKDGIAMGSIKLSELVKDTQKDEARRYDAAVAGAEGGALKRLNLYRQAVDQTQTAPASAPVVSIATFQQKYKEFFEAYNTLYKKDPKAAEAKRAEFFSTLRNFRLR